MDVELQASIRAHRVQAAQLLDLTAKHAALVARACARLADTARRKCSDDGSYDDPQLNESLRLLAPAIKAAQSLIPFPTIPGADGDAPAEPPTPLASRNDTTRLDWMEAMRPRFGLGEDGEARLLSRGGDGELLASNPTLREAIDAAMMLAERAPVPAVDPARAEREA